jgi:hypothetical protein
VAHSGTDGVPGFLNDMWVWPTSPSSGNDDGWWTPGGWIPANLPIVVDNTAGPSYSANPKSLQFKNSGATYGTLGSGVSCSSGASCTVPGARWGGVTWTDASGNLWMFGGQGVNGLLNDIWEFDITSGPCAYDVTTGTGIFTNCKWIWQGGSQFANQPTTTTFPGARWGAASYTDASGNLWLFGGQGYDSSGNIGLLNDLWKYNIGTKTWTLILPSGVLSNQNGSYRDAGNRCFGQCAWWPPDRGSPPMPRLRAFQAPVGELPVGSAQTTATSSLSPASVTARTQLSRPAS